MIKVTLAVKPESDFLSWLEYCKKHYVKERIKSNEDEAVANESADKQFKELFPEDKPTEEQLVYDVRAGDEKVGTLWIGLRRGQDKSSWWIYSIEIDEQFRRRGYARETMRLAEETVREHGGKKLGLNVFGHNKAARQLYDSVGYGVIATTMEKDL